MARLTSHGYGLWTATQPLSFLGLHIGTRMAVVRLSGGDLYVHSPIALDDAVRAEVDALGPVRHVVAPNLYHHLHARQWVQDYPDALVHAPAGLAKKRPDLRIDRVLDATEPEPSWAGQLDLVNIEGSMLGETVVVHRASRSLLSCDLIENFRTSDHAPTRWYLKVGGIHGKPGLHRLLRLAVRDKRAMRASLDRLLKHDFDRMVLAHGDVLERGAKDVLREAYAFL